MIHKSIVSRQDYYYKHNKDDSYIPKTSARGCDCARCTEWSGIASWCGKATTYGASHGMAVKFNKNRLKMTASLKLVVEVGRGSLCVDCPQVLKLKLL